MKRQLFNPWCLRRCRPNRSPIYMTPRLGPAPFVFVSSLVGKRSPAFSKTFKVLATAIVALLGAALFQVWRESQQSGAFLGVAGGWFVAALVLMVTTWWYILRSTTRIEDGHLHQTWVWNKQMEICDLAYGKLIWVRGLEWLIAPRLYVRSLMGKFSVFYAASPEMIAEFERLVLELKTFRTGL